MLLTGPKPFCCIGKNTYKMELLEKSKLKGKRLGGFTQG